MSAEELLQASERSALEKTEFISRVSGVSRGAQKKRRGSLGAVGLVTLLLIGLVVLVSSGSLIPAAILNQLIEATDMQYADAVESKILVFSQALESGTVPENTKKRLEEQGVKVEGTNLVYNGQTVSAGEFVNKVHSDANLYKAFNTATYDRAAYYYDESAEKVFQKIGSNRDNYSKNTELDTVVSGLMGEGSDINVSNVAEVKKTDDKGNEYTDYEATESASSNVDAGAFIQKVADNNIAEDTLTATLNATDALNTADTISKEQRSSIFFTALMENISKMKAGDGSESQINEMMNFLYKDTESSVLDINTGMVVTVKGSAVESPSLYAILTGEKVNGSEVSNYASDRVLKTIENRTGVNAVSQDTKEGTVTSTAKKSKGTIGRLLPEMGLAADGNILSTVTPTINNSLMDNGFQTLGGIRAGEFLVEGAVNVGKELAKASGGTAGDAAAAESYARLNNTILALDAESDRIGRNPFDITSKNTFFGSIVYKMGVAVYKNSQVSSSWMGSIIKNLGSMIRGVFNSTYAEDNNNYLTNYGNCETIGAIGAVGSVGCSEIATFDSSTLNDTFHDAGFINFVETNTTLNADGSRSINKNSALANFIKYNNERVTPIGVMDGGILESINKDSSSIPFLSNIIAMIKAFLNADEGDKALATGKAFVNSAANPDWQTYKYAQRYVSLARATDALRQYDGEETAYNNIKYFEGGVNPVIAFLEEYYANL